MLYCISWGSVPGTRVGIRKKKNGLLPNLMEKLLWSFLPLPPSSTHTVPVVFAKICKLFFLIQFPSWSENTLPAWSRCGNLEQQLWDFLLWKEWCWSIRRLLIWENQMVKEKSRSHKGHTSESDEICIQWPALLKYTLFLKDLRFSVTHLVMRLCYNNSVGSDLPILQKLVLLLPCEFFIPILPQLFLLEGKCIS